MALKLAQYDAAAYEPQPLAPNAPAAPGGVAPRGAMRLSVREAAARAGLDEGRIRQLCLERWGPAGLASQERPADGGRREWRIWDYADPRLARRHVMEAQQAESFAGLTDAQRDIIALRRLVLAQWEAHQKAVGRFGRKKGPATDEFLMLLEAGRVLDATGKPVRGPDGSHLKMRISSRTLYNWESASKAGPMALLDGRTAKEMAAQRDDPYWAEVRQWYLTQNEPTVLAVTKIVNAVAHQQGWPLRSVHQVRRYISSLPRATVALHRRGEEEYDNAFGGYVERDYTTLRVNQIWCGDHHPCDLIVHYKGRLVRPWISAWEDMRSRRVFYVFTPQPPDSNTVINALFNGIKATGQRVPEQVYIDNGKDYDCYTLQGQTKAQRLQRSKLRVEVETHRFGGILGGMQIDVVHARPYNPKAKPVERFFRTYSEAVDKFEPTYTGNKPENKPEGLEDKVRKFNEAVRSATPADVAAGIGHVVPSFEDYVARAAAWIEEVYHHDIHRGHGMEVAGRPASPLEVYNHYLADSANRVISEQAMTIAQLRIEKTRKVSRSGQINHNRFKYGRGQPELVAIQGERVVVRVDPADIKRVSVWSQDGRFICHATETGRVPWGTSLEQLKTAARQHRAQKNAAKELGLSPMVVAKSAVELLVQNSINERASRPPLPPPEPTTSFRPVQTGFESQADLYEASEARRVVNGPSATEPDFRSRMREQSRGQSRPASPATAPIANRGLSLLERMRGQPRAPEPDGEGEGGGHAG